jgi:alkanesulfonate monooxygenase SsuD/methylene tetrahydromethanopterin reductase-like flavin-dependent oxidoreductase (luciferase family)
MRYGLEICCGGSGVEAADLVALGVLAERSGFDGVFFEDYLVYYSEPDAPTHDPWLLLAAISAGTDRIRLGTTVTGLPARQLAKLAREALTLDHLSGGRAVLGVGLGDPHDRGVSAIHETAGAPGTGGPRAPEGGRPGGSAGERAARYDEGLDVLLGLLGGTPVRHTGRYYRVDGVAYRPGPVQTPRLPVWVGGSLEAGAAVRRAARCDGIVPYRCRDTDSWADVDAGQVAELRRRLGPAADIAIGGRRRRADQAAEREYVAGLADAGATWWLEFVPPGDPAEMRDLVARGPLR